jgi:hypothetical protein
MGFHVTWISSPGNAADNSHPVMLALPLLAMVNSPSNAPDQSAMTP